ncbi:MAG: FCD domain-containing protein [Lachnospiraceae bacterium]|nr:FCD domain-containing protein [Lachnospiraceae bacterium]
MGGHDGYAELSAGQNKENDQIAIVKNYFYSLLKEDKIKIGDRLPSEKALSEQLNVTKSAVRDALQSLKAVGLLSSVRGSGYRLTPDFDYSLADILHAMVVHSSASRRDIREVREALEIKELDLIIEAGPSEEFLNELQEQVDLMLSYVQKNIETEDQAEELVLTDMKFHQMLAEGSNNLFIRAFYIALNEYHGENKKADPKVVRQRASDELLYCHERILKALREKDLQSAVSAIRDHYAIGDKITQARSGDPVLESAILELQKKGISRDQIMEKLLELQ